MRVGTTKVDITQKSTMMIWTELDSANLKRVPDLTKLAEEEESISEESDVPTNVQAIAAGNKGGDMVSQEKDEVRETRKSPQHR
jgi:hypothetical protein